MINIAIFASGSGTNAEQLILHFQENSSIHIQVIFCNNPTAGVLERAKRLGIESIIFTKSDFSDPVFLNHLTSRGINAIVLAGFLWKIPIYLIDQYPEMIINIHPALLPLYGGKGMYGHHVHEAVIQNHDQQSGITIHLVNEYYDKGRILFQATCDVADNDTPDSLAKKIHQLEHQHFPQVVEDYFTETV